MIAGAPAEKPKSDFHRAYFPHVDGLRALAIAAVVLYHFYPAACPGGFTGVDVFFVISGYLITGGILSDLRNGTFSILTFYVRRIKRVLPAYLALVAGVLLISPFVFSLHQVKSISATSLYSLLYSANIYFYKVVSYFDLDARSNPLLHLWSLGVEEQFYLVVPVCIWLLWRIRRNLVLFNLGLLFAASLLGSIAAIHHGHSQFAFFMLPTRAWELLAGSILVLLPPPVPGRAGTAATALAGWLGAALIVVPYALYNDATPFPGAAALPPVLGAALLIRFGGEGVLRRALASAPAVGIGKVSYSLYLWHWAIFILFLGGDSSWKRAVAGIVLSLAAAYLSWRFVETPVRRLKNFGPRHAFTLLIVGSALIAGACLSIRETTPRAGEVPRQWHGLPTWMQFEIARDKRISTTDPESLAARKPEVLIPLGAAGKPPTFVLWGDSHALALMPGADRVAAEYGKAGLFVNLKHAFTTNTRIGFAPFRPVEDREPVLRWLESSPDITDVWLVNRWATQVHKQEDIDALAGLCERLRRAGKRVFVFRDVPENSENGLRRLDWGLHADLATFHVGTESYNARNALQDRALAALAGVATVLPADQAFQDDGGYETATLTPAGIACYYLDHDHVNEEGAVRVMRFLAPQLWGAGAGKPPLPPAAP